MLDRLAVWVALGEPLAGHGGWPPWWEGWWGSGQRTTRPGEESNPRPAGSFRSWWHSRRERRGHPWSPSSVCPLRLVRGGQVRGDTRGHLLNGCRVRCFPRVDRCGFGGWVGVCRHPVRPFGDLLDGCRSGLVGVRGVCC